MPGWAGTTETGRNLTMRKLVESTFVSLDGVIGNPQNWGPPYWDDEHAGYAHRLLFGADALLLGRKTYEAFAQAWPGRPSDDYVDRINGMPKYVASTTLSDADATWNATILRDDVAGEVAKLASGITVNVYGPK
jgi:dihydrofolate reductase